MQEMRAKKERGEQLGLQERKPRKVATSGRKAGRPRKSAAAAAPAAASAAASAAAPAVAPAAAPAGTPAKPEADPEEVEEEDYASDDSEGEGDHRIEQLVRQMRQGGSRWILVKWASFGHQGNTWEPRKNLHEEAVEDFDAKEKVALAPRPIALWARVAAPSTS